MVDSILKCPTYKNHQDDVILFCIKSDCKFKAQFLCMTCIADNEHDHLKEHKN